MIKFRPSGPLSKEDEGHRSMLERYLRWHEGCAERHGVLMGVEAWHINKVAEALVHFYGPGARVFKKFRDGAMGYDCEVTVSSIRCKHPWDICNVSLLFPKEQKAHFSRRLKVAAFNEGDVVKFVVNGVSKEGIVAYVNEVTCTVATAGERTRLMQPHLLTKTEEVPGG